MCLSSFEVQLADPIGSRKVIDDRRHTALSVTLALPLAMPAPSWLPGGWTLQQEGGVGGDSVSVYGKVAGGPSVSVSLTSVADALERFRGAPIDGTAAVKGRSALWAHPVDQPGASALIVHDEHWTLIVQDNDSTVGHDSVERIANSLTPFPFPDTVVVPSLPQAWTGNVADVRGKEGRATVRGWLVIDDSGESTICDELQSNATACSEPTMIIDWATGNVQPPEGLVVRGNSRVSNAPIALTGTVKDTIFFVGL